MHLRRAIMDDLRAYTRHFPVLLITGARQVGKSTLAMHLGLDHYITLDDISLYEAAKADPQGFIRALPKPVVIDEIQRIPELLLAIKECVDQERINGSFVLTGSSSLAGFKSISDSLAGRVGIVELYPFSLKEIRGKQENLIEMLCGDLDAFMLQAFPGALTAEIIQGGYPEMIRIEHGKARYLWFSSYIRTYIESDAREMANIRNIDKFIRMYRLCMLRSAGLFNKSEIQQEAGLDNKTFDSYFNVLEHTYQLGRLLPYFNNRLKRLIKTPKIFAIDTGILCHLLQIATTEAFEASHFKGAILETWVFNELLKASGSARKPAQLHYYRSSDKREVDFIVEVEGKVIAIEVKSKTSINRDDFRHILTLQAELGQDFDKGIVLYRGDRCLKLGDRLYALPLGFLG